MAEWVLLALWMSGNLNSPQATAFNHVRSPEAGLRNLIVEGYGRSPTFKRLVDATEELDCIVYITTAVKLRGDTRGALLHTPVGLRDMPLLRVLVKSNLSPEEAIATIAHELQHVVEAVSDQTAIDARTMRAVFDKLDPLAARTNGGRRYETDAAIEVTRKVRRELSQTRPRTRNRRRLTRSLLANASL